MIGKSAGPLVPSLPAHPATSRSNRRYREALSRQMINFEAEVDGRHGCAGRPLINWPRSVTFMRRARKSFCTDEEPIMKSDERKIERDVRDELKWDPDLDASDIAVSVKGGVVTLAGFRQKILRQA